MSDLPHAGLDAGRAALQQFLTGDTDLEAMRTRIMLLATETIPACDAASITMLRNGEATTPTYTSKTALHLDEVQYETGEGPCLASIRHRGVERVSVGADARWPVFAAAAAEEGVRAVLALPLGNGEGVLGSLNLYSETAPAYDGAAEEVAGRFADQLGVAVARVTLYVEGYELAHQLAEAMQSRAVIEQAKGILMAAERCGPEAAFDILRRASQNHNRKLRAIATDIVERYASPGESTEPGRAPRRGG
jgi:GAF domain-containing protein